MINQHRPYAMVLDDVTVASFILDSQKHLVPNMDVCSFQESLFDNHRQDFSFWLVLRVSTGLS